MFGLRTSGAIVIGRSVSALNRQGPITLRWVVLGRCGAVSGAWHEVKIGASCTAGIDETPDVRLSTVKIRGFPYPTHRHGWKVRGRLEEGVLASRASAAIPASENRRATVCAKATVGANTAFFTWSGVLTVGGEYELGSRGLAQRAAHRVGVVVPGGLDDGIEVGRLEVCAAAAHVAG
jgi:hypothetical protein